MYVESWVWIVWLIISLGGFAILETISLANRKRGDTLSENTRRWLGIDPPNPVARIGIPLFVAVLVIFVIWFIPHIVFQIW
jgi:hypothetical protein